MIQGGIVGIRDVLLEKQAKGMKIARTESGDPSFDVEGNVKTAMHDALIENKTHYTPGAGIAPLRKAIYEKVIRENKSTIKGPESVIVTSGAMNALYTVFKGIALTNAAHPFTPKEVLVPTPTWTETVDNVSLTGMKPVYYNLYFGQEIPVDISELEQLVDEDTVAMVINSPHNPTGTVIPDWNLKQIIEFCKKHDLYLISDEAYEHIVYEPAKHFSPDALIPYDKTISIYSFSKSHCMSGLRVGYAIIKDPELFTKVSGMVRCTINGVNSIAQWGAATAISYKKPNFEGMVEAYQRRRDMLFEGLQKCSLVTPILPDGTFYIWAKINDENMDSWDFTEKLLESGVGSAPGDVFGPGGKGYIRFSFSCQDSHVETAAEAMSKL